MIKRIKGDALREQESAINFDTTEQDLYYALTNVEPERVHITLTIDDFDCITEERRYILYNKGTQKVSILPLPARERKTQRNMKVEDALNRTIVFIPSSSSTHLLEKACTHIIEEANKHLDAHQKEVYKKIKDGIKPNLIKVFTYKPDPEEIKSVCTTMGTIFESETLKSKKFMEEISILVKILEHYNDGLYYPLVTLFEPLEPRTYTLLKLSVERLREYLSQRWERFKVLLKFGFLGSFTFSWQPELYPDISNHVRIYAPEGLVIRNVEFDMSQPEESAEKMNLKELEKDLNEKKKDYFDEKCFYIQLGPEESKTMCNCTHFNIDFGLRKKGFHLSLLQLLSLFLWLTVISPLFFDELRNHSSILTLLTLSVTILVAIGIYALDKKIVNHFITTQVVLVFLVFAGEILFMIF